MSALALIKESKVDLSVLAEDMTVTGLRTINRRPRIPFLTLNFRPLINKKKVANDDEFFDCTNEVNLGKQLENVTLLLAQPRRRRLLGTYPEQEEVCSSPDGRTGVDLGTGELIPCEACPHAQWERRGRKIIKKPACTEMVQVLAVDDQGRPFAMRFKGVAIKPFNDHLDKNHRGRLNALPGFESAPASADVPLYLLRLTIHGEMDSRNGFTFGLPSFEVTGVNDTATFREYREIVREHEEELLRSMGISMEDADEKAREATAAGAEESSSAGGDVIDVTVEDVKSKSSKGSRKEATHG